MDRRNGEVDGKSVASGEMLKWSGALGVYDRVEDRLVTRSMRARALRRSATRG